MEKESTPPAHPGFEIKPPPPARNGYRAGLPMMSEFVTFLDANEGVWAVFHTYLAKQSGYQRASDAQKKYGDRYEFVARNSDEGTTVYGRRKLTF